MRNIERIEPFMKKFEELWKENPDMRFGQMVTWISAYLPPYDSFYCEETDWLSAIERCRK